jgi:hypothetical protein
MVFHKFDRQLFVRLESTEGSYLDPKSATYYIETLEDASWNITPRTEERNIARPAFTRVPNYHASDGITTSDTVVAEVEFSFGVELTAKTAGNASADPGWTALMQACGLELFGTGGTVKRDSIASITGGPFLHREEAIATGTTQAVGTTFQGETVYYYTGTTPTAGTLTGTVSGATGTVGAVGTAAGCAFGVNTEKGVGNGSSASMALYIDGRYCEAYGCRGNVQIELTATQRVIMRFTMRGILREIANASQVTGISYGHQIPPSFVAANMFLRENTGSTTFGTMLFNQMTIDLGNEVTMRDDANSANGWKAAQITDRAPTLSINPDAIVGGATSASVFDFFEKWIAGTECSLNFRVGTLHGGNCFLFKMPALQFTGVADGDRDNFTVYDCSALIGGGAYGDAVDQSTGQTQLYDNKGADNEFVMICN